MCNIILGQPLAIRSIQTLDLFRSCLKPTCLLHINYQHVMYPSAHISDWDLSAIVCTVHYNCMDTVLLLLATNICHTDRSRKTTVVVPLLQGLPGHHFLEGRWQFQRDSPGLPCTVVWNHSIKIHTTSKCIFRNHSMKTRTIFNTVISMMCI